METGKPKAAGEGPPRGYRSRSRGLEKFQQVFPVDLVAVLAARRETVPDVRVLEIGCGEGRLLMDLRRHFPDIELHGINKRRWPAMNDRASFGEAGKFYEIFTEHEIAELTLPFVHFQDASKLHFDDNSLDLIVSQKAIHYVHRKDLVLEEAWRTLRPDGLALLEIDERRPRPPDFFVGDTPRFIVYDGGTPVPLADHVAAIRARGFDIELTHKDADGFRLSSVRMRKNVAAPLPLGLDYDADSSFLLRMRDKPEEIFWGYRSVYRVRREP